MPFVQLVTAGIETLINHTLDLDSNSQQGLKKLSGKRLTLHVKELPWPVTLAFSNRVDLLLNQQQADCTLCFSMTDLNELKDSANISKLIQQNRIVLEGDLQLAQQVSRLFLELEIDWQEKLATWLGDPIAHQVAKGLQQLHYEIQGQLATINRIAKNIVVEEKQVLTSKMACADFAEQVYDNQNRLERLLARVQQLEHAQ